MPPSKPRRAAERAFSFARGVRLQGTNIACDALGAADELVFLSHAQALGSLGRRHLPLRRAGRQEVLVTEETLALLGPSGTRLRRHALPAMFGRPFKLGESRVELFPSGHLPGSASLLVETDSRRLVYAGTISTENTGFGAAPAEFRGADAVCIDATFGDARFALPPREEALAAVVTFTRACLDAGQAPVLLTPPFSTAMETAAALVAAGMAVRGHRAIVAAASTFRAAAVRTPIPAIARFAGRLAPREALLWPPDARDARSLGQLTAPRFAFVSGFSLDRDALTRVRADVAIPLSNQSGFSGLMAYLEATSAREVAVYRGCAESLAATLRQRGVNAYALGPPRQMDLFRG